MIEYSLTDNSYRFGKLVLDQNFTHLGTSP